MKTYSFKRKLVLHTDMDTCWEFFSNPANLKRITPESMGFEIISGADRKMFPGQIIEYHVSPLGGVRMNWVTEITHVKDRFYFVDEQRSGPYRFWHHKHFFTPVENGVLMEDIIHYSIPGGFFGRLLNRFFIRKKLAKIFDFRERIVEKLFNKVGKKEVKVT